VIARIPVFSDLEDLLFWGLRNLGPGKGHLGLPWAWAIVAITIVVRLLLVPVMVRQIHSMQAMQRHMPEMKAIQERFKDDRQKKQEELMRFYKENKINPAASCLPMLVQIPIFLALYQVLRHQIAHQEAHLSWLGIVPNITDSITSHWSGYVLLVIYVISQMASSYYMSASAEKTQRIIMIFMPLVFVLFIIHPFAVSTKTHAASGKTVTGFPMGLLIYWVTTNLWTVGQGLVTRQLTPKPVPPPKRTSRTPPANANPAAPTKASGNGKRTASGQPQVRRVKRKKGGR
jgi:YidC/Oxa1 family membrane protein insertase